ncbi:AMP-binding protein [Desulfatitalea tepidiphila]|uniref:AMP-binding protein n=1 Tax=Desulfatitalea tepidiphila TaxID=1185843 RepID=UPI0006B4D17D|nr:AMP-binding protein [Desulfatitalea tepidiphila]
MEPIWIEQWPSFIPKEITYPRGRKPVFEYLRDNAREFPDRTAIVFYGKEVTYGELDRMSEQFAHYLMDAGFQKGDRIALFLPSCPQYHIAHYGICKMGGVIVPCSPLFKEWELAYQLRDTGAKAIVSLDLLYPVVAAATLESDLKTVLVTSLHDFLPPQPTMNLAPMMAAPKATIPDATEFMDIFARYPSDPVKVTVELDDPVQLQFTGGTTGLPKGAILTHSGKLFKVAALMSVKEGNRQYLNLPGEFMISLAILPTFHIAGMLGAVDTMIAMGDTQILMLMFDPVAAMQAIERYKVQFFQAAVPMNMAIMGHPDRPQYDLSSLRLCLTTSFGIQLTEAIAKRWADDTGGCLLAEAAYGLTETHTFDTFMPIDKPKFAAGCQGIPIPGQQIKIVSWEDRAKEVPVGEMGEIVIKNPAVLKGYWNKPEETREALVDGWVYTGDMGKFDDDGFLYFLGRKKEMIKVSGFSVFPEEVETFLLTHEAVDKVAVIGAPDPKKGEVIKAFVVPKPQFKGKISADEIIAWAKPRISSYKVPQAVDFRDELPMSGVGKVLRRVLVEEEQNKK